MIINALWNNGNESDWKDALAIYYNNPYDKALEDRMERLMPSDIEKMSVKEFYSFLYDEYFVWKYTAKNRLATTRKALSKYETEGLNKLAGIQREILLAYKENPNDSEKLITITKEIYGLGTAGATGLLSILYPDYYGTLDQFLVSALLEIDNLPEHNRLKTINSLSITIKDGVVLERILRKKAKELNTRFETNEWTPRRLDMVLWATGRY